LKSVIVEFYNTEVNYINSLTVENLNEARNAANKIASDIDSFARTTFKTFVKEKLQTISEELVDSITYTALKDAVQLYCSTAILAVNLLNDLEDLVDSFNSIYTNTLTFIQTKTAELLTSLKNSALESIDTYINELIDDIDNDDIKTGLQSFYTEEKGKLSSVSSFDDVAPTVLEIKNDLLNYVKDEYKDLAVAALDAEVNKVLNKISNDDLKAKVNEFYTSEKEYILSLTTLEDIEGSVAKVALDTAEFALDVLKPFAITKLNAIINPLINEITYNPLKTSVQSFYDTEINKLNSVEDLEDVIDTFKEIHDDTIAYIQTQTEAILIQLKNAAIDELNPYVETLIATIPNETLKSDTQDFYDEEIKKLEDVTTFDGFAPVVLEIKDDLVEYVFTETKKIILEELDTYLTTLINKIPYESVKEDTEELYDTEIAKLNAVTTIEGFSPVISEIKEDLEDFVLEESLEVAVAALEDVIEKGIAKLPTQDLKDSFSTYSDGEMDKIEAIDSVDDLIPTIKEVTEDTVDYVKSLLKPLIQAFINQLLATQNTSAYDYLPSTMSPTYSSNLVNASDINYDFTSFTAVSDINLAGFGEQWQMVVENIDGLNSVAKVFNTIQTALTAATIAVDLEQTIINSDNVSYSFSTDNVKGSVYSSSSTTKFEFTFTKNVTIPVLGTLKPTIIIENNLSTSERTVYISAGDAFKAKYESTSTSFEMAVKYGVNVSNKSASRTSYLSIVKEDNLTTGHIYEYTTLNGSDMIKACSDFYIDNSYVTVVGNKASGLLVTGTNYISEVYSKTTGHMLGYEIKEGNYNTLWFNLSDVSGLNNIKVTEKTGNDIGTQNNTYFNDSNNKIKCSTNFLDRQYDVELRKRFYYSYDDDAKTYSVSEKEIPMLFVQEQNLSKFSDNMFSKNGFTLSIAIDTNDLNKILNDYDEYIPTFIENCDNMSSDSIITYLNSYENN